jgi:hypothetical protein
MRKIFPAIGTFISWSSPFNPFLVQACQSWRGGASDPNPRPKTANQFPHPSSFSADCTRTLMVPSIFIQKKLTKLKKKFSWKCHKQRAQQQSYCIVSHVGENLKVLLRDEKGEREGWGGRKRYNRSIFLVWPNTKVIFEICRGLKLYRKNCKPKLYFFPGKFEEKICPKYWIYDT